MAGGAEMVVAGGGGNDPFPPPVDTPFPTSPGTFLAVHGFKRLVGLNSEERRAP